MASSHQEFHLPENLPENSVIRGICISFICFPFLKDNAVSAREQICAAPEGGL